MSAHEEARGCPSPPPPAPATGPAHVARPHSSAQLPDLSLGQKQPRRLGPVRSGQRAVARQGHRRRHRFPRRVGELCERGTAAPGSPGPVAGRPKGRGIGSPSGWDAVRFRSQLGTDTTTGQRDGGGGRGVQGSRNQSTRNRGTVDGAAGGRPDTRRAVPAFPVRSHFLRTHIPRATERSKGTGSVPRKPSFSRWLYLETPKCGFSMVLLHRLYIVLKALLTVK